MKLIAATPALPVKDIQRSVDFYCGVLGFESVHQEDGFALLRRDAVELTLWSAYDESWRAPRAAQSRHELVVSGAESFIAGTASCRLELEGVDEFHDALKPAGIMHPNAPLRDEGYGTREFSVSDPDNNLNAFFERK